MIRQIYKEAYDARYKPCEHAAAHLAGLQAVAKAARTWTPPGASRAERQRNMALEALRDLGVKLGVLDPNVACDGPQLLAAMDAYAESLAVVDVAELTAEFKPGDLVRNARYDHRDVYPAFGESAYVQAVDGDYLDFGQGHKLLYSLFDRATPAPVATPDVPDSLRALSEAATQGEWSFQRMGGDFAGVYSDDATGSVIGNFAGFMHVPRAEAEQDANARLAAEAVNHVRALIAAQPGGQACVPDSVRALSEALAMAETAMRHAVDTYNAVLTRADTTGTSFSAAERALRDTAAAYRNAKDALADQCLTLIAAQPGGQAGDAGEEIDQQSAWARAAETVGTDKPWWWDKPWAEMGYGVQGDVQAWFQNRDPLHRVVEPDGPDRYVRLHRDPRPHMLAPAPNSTRTGVAETEVVEAVARAIFDADEDVNDAKEAELRAKGNHVAADCLAGPRARWDDPRNAPILDAFRHRARKAIEALAARREAPSDAGWSRTGSGRQPIGFGPGEWEWFRAADAALRFFPDGFNPNSGRYERLVINSPTPPTDPAPSGQARDAES